MSYREYLFDKYEEYWRKDREWQDELFAKGCKRCDDCGRAIVGNECWTCRERRMDKIYEQIKGYTCLISVIIFIVMMVI